MIYFRSSIFSLLSIAYLLGFSATAFPQESEANHNLTGSILNSQTFPEEQEITPINSNKTLFLLAMGVTSIITGITLFFLFQSDANSNNNKSSLKSDQEPVNFKPETATFTSENTPVEVPEQSLSSVNQSQQKLNLPLPSTLNIPFNSESSISPLTTATMLIIKQQNQTKENLSFEFNHTLIRYSAEDHTASLPVQTKSIDLVFELIQDLQASNQTTRSKAIWELAQKSDSRAIAPLIRIIPQASSAEKSLILEAITQITNRSIKLTHQVLLNSFHDPNPQVRKNAIRDSTLLYQLTSEVTQHLAQLLQDANPEVRQTACWAWKQFNSPSNRSHHTLPEIANNQDNLSR